MLMMSGDFPGSMVRLARGATSALSFGDMAMSLASPGSRWDGWDFVDSSLVDSFTSRFHKVTATAHKLARIVYALMRHGGEYVKRTEADDTEQVRARLERSLHKRAKELGYEVTKLPDPATPEVT
jgi:hypothetical protein